MARKLDWEKAKRNPLGYEQAAPASPGFKDELAKLRRAASRAKPLQKKRRKAQPITGFRRCDRCKVLKALERFAPAYRGRLLTCRTCIRLYLLQDRNWASVPKLSRAEYEATRGKSDKPRAGER